MRAIKCYIMYSCVTSSSDTFIYKSDLLSLDNMYIYILSSEICIYIYIQITDYTVVFCLLMSIIVIIIIFAGFSAC